jgi:hypothetical protein
MSILAIIIDMAARFSVGGALRSHRRARAAIAMTSGTASEATRRRRNGCPSDGFASTAVFRILHVKTGKQLRFDGVVREFCNGFL